MWACIRSRTHGMPAGHAPATEPQPPVSILLVADQFLPVVGGTEVTTLREAKALRARGHAARVLTLRHNPKWPRTEEMEGVPVRRTGGVYLRGRLRLRFGATWLAEARIWYELMLTHDTYDVVHLKQLARLARPTLLASFFTRKPLIVELAAGPVTSGEEYPPDDLRATLQGNQHVAPQPCVQSERLSLVCNDIEVLHQTQRLASLTLRLLHAPHVRFRALSSRIVTSLTHSGFDARHVALVPNGIDPSLYRETAEQSSRSAGETIPTIVCVARLTYQKGQDVLLQAWRSVHERVPAARLILAGEGPMRPQLMALAEALNMADSTAFEGTVRDVPALLAKADAFALPSRFEGMPNALLEAMAAGLPCVATRVGGSEEVIVDGVSGLLVPAEDPQALADALVSLLTDHERARALGREAQARVISNFAHGRVLDMLIQMYSSLVRNVDTNRRQTRSQLADSPQLASATSAATDFIEDEINAYPTGDAADNIPGSD